MVQYSIYVLFRALIPWAHFTPFFTFHGLIILLIFRFLCSERVANGVRTIEILILEDAYCKNISAGLRPILCCKERFCWVLQKCSFVVNYFV
jgi:hypothetical protein